MLELKIFSPQVERTGQDLFQVLCLQPRQHRHYRNVRIRVSCLQHFWERR